MHLLVTAIDVSQRDPVGGWGAVVSRMAISLSCMSISGMRCAVFMLGILSGGMGRQGDDVFPVIPHAGEVRHDG
ncbi:hypothetical protein CO615_04630 [Lysobacteraceae bacterium NML75-0749]|nr:hypothetical protein CO615_04630 [Xanthomonadaceae bacterium NML75-0749]